ncbi:N-acetylated-alpha-linked acidic dipeptidase [Histoplasma capsulatum var. duboisii H88]|uniref:N-acetylated-alpha-linked acidic dipeptidase n=2 Tax=Ajellomyces capsulatus TaxID=5037 RepID=A0A8H8D3E7_AJECA|nr:N-acetylated-alpha-linked acidic dipeptidase [Histoplasma capsulatum]QSS57819.1 N-acetylated-alpha-linked acidic dipeptidase [Histoplasma capsulatum var. duboisii H88]QSS67139.1 N-acetylated-alpha-linked acidic dipeptidase [Histoplasma capsulatum G186AR]
MQLLALSLLAASASVVDACVSDHLMDRSFDMRQLDLAKRSSKPPPALTEQESILVNSFDNNTISDWLYYYTHGLHIAGTNKTMAQWTADRWTEFGVPSSLAEYYVYLNYPVSSSLSLTLADGTVWNAELDEDVLAADDTTSYPNRVPIFHGYSASGDAKAEFVYVGRGQQVDFDRLVELGVDLKGKIAMARYGGPFRGLKVKNAQDYGMLGCVIFTDPGDDGNVTEANGYVAYPDGPARQPSSVQRGSVLFLSTAPGDPTTPGYPSKEDSPRADTSPVVPKIPSIPISYANAQKILGALDGQGQSADAVNRTKWVGGLDVQYSSGPAPGVELSLSNVMRDEVAPIYNPIGIINGTKEDEVIVVGNHWDAWIIGGAVDPNSGSAVMVELAKALGKLQESGWKPKRTIVLASWDGEEYGLLGSTEWVEEYVNWLKETCVAYVNIDSAVSGPHPGLSGTPGLHQLSIELMKKISWPYKGDESLTMYDMWLAGSKGQVGVLGSGSDYTAFVHAGLPSVNVGSSGGSGDPVYHYHSNYDSFHWVDTYGDPGFVFHKAMGQYLALLTYHLASDDIIPFEVNNYGPELAKYLASLRKVIDASGLTVDLSRLEAAMEVLNKAAKATTELRDQAIKTGDERLIDLVNAKFRDFERGFVSQGGLPNREFYKHLIWAPGLDTGYAPTTFPGITEAVQGGDQALAQEFVERTSNAIYIAAGILTP